MENYFYFDKLILDSRNIKRSGNAGIIKDDFDQSEKCIDFENKSENSPVINYFINGDFFLGTYEPEKINRIVVIGDVCNSKEDEEKITHIKPENVQNAIKRIINRELQRNWQNGDKIDCIENDSKVINCFINNDLYLGTLKMSTNSMVVVGNIDTNVVKSAKKIVHISPLSSESEIRNVIDRKFQKNWKSVDESLKGKSFDTYEKSIVLLRTYSHIISRFKELDNRDFNTICRKILEYSEKLYSDLYPKKE